MHFRGFWWFPLWLNSLVIRFMSRVVFKDEWLWVSWLKTMLFMMMWFMFFRKWNECLLWLRTWSFWITFLSRTNSLTQIILFRFLCFRESDFLFWFLLCKYLMNRLILILFFMLYVWNFDMLRILAKSID